MWLPQAAPEASAPPSSPPLERRWFTCWGGKGASWETGTSCRLAGFDGPLPASRASGSVSRRSLHFSPDQTLRGLQKYLLKAPLIAAPLAWTVVRLLCLSWPAVLPRQEEWALPACLRVIDHWKLTGKTTCERDSGCRVTHFKELIPAPPSLAHPLLIS